MFLYESTTNLKSNATPYYAIHGQTTNEIAVQLLGGAGDV